MVDDDDGRDGSSKSQDGRRKRDDLIVNLSVD